jgi:hypothetical protein
MEVARRAHRGSPVVGGRGLEVERDAAAKSEFSSQFFRCTPASEWEPLRAPCVGMELIERSRTPPTAAAGPRVRRRGQEPLAQ